MKSLFEYYKAFERKFSKEERQTLADKGMALPDGSFPIENVEDLKNAIKAFGRAKDKQKAKAWVIKRAKEMNKVDLLPDSWNIGESINEAKRYAKPPKPKQKVQEDEAPNYPQELDDVIDDLELEIESYFDDHDELMTSTLHDYIIEAIKEKLKEESFDDWDKNYNHEVIRDVLDNVKENKSKIIEIALENLFSSESRILDEVREDLEAAKDRQNEYESQRAEDKANKQTGTVFDISEDEEEEYENDEEEEEESEGSVILKSVETLEAKLTKEHYIKEYKKLFDKHFKLVSNKIKRIAR